MKNTIKYFNYQAVLEFTDPKLFTLFLVYAKESYCFTDKSKPKSVYNYFIKGDAFVDAETLTITFQNVHGLENMINKFFLENGLPLPADIQKDFIDTENKEIGYEIKKFFLTNNYPLLKYLCKYIDFGRLDNKGFSRMFLVKNSLLSDHKHEVLEVMVPERTINLMQQKWIFNPDIINTIIKKAHSDLVKDNPPLFPLVIWNIIISYFLEVDNTKMVATSVGESKLSLLAQQLPFPTEDIRAMKVALSHFKGDLDDWKPLYQDDLALGIRIGISKSGRPALAAMGHLGFQIILEENDSLIVVDKSQNDKILEPVAALEQIRIFSALFKLADKPSSASCLVM